MADHNKKLLFAIMEYIVELQDSSSPIIANHHELAFALSSLQTAFDLHVEDKEDQKAYSIKPDSLSNIFHEFVAKKDPINDPEFKTKFDKYLKLLEDRGYFLKVTKGTPEYQELYDKAKKRFIDKYSPSPSSSTETVKVETVQIETVNEEKIQSEKAPETQEEKKTEPTTSSTETGDRTGQLDLPPFLNDMVNNQQMQNMMSSFLSNPQITNMLQGVLSDENFTNEMQDMLKNLNKKP